MTTTSATLAKATRILAYLWSAMVGVFLATAVAVAAASGNPVGSFADVAVMVSTVGYGDATAVLPRVVAVAVCTVAVAWYLVTVGVLALLGLRVLRWALRSDGVPSTKTTG